MDHKAINTKQEGDCGYLCFYGDKKAGIYAKDMYKAKLAAIEHFKVSKARQHLVSAHLCENRDGSQYLQPTTF